MLVKYRHLHNYFRNFSHCVIVKSSREIIKFCIDIMKNRYYVITAHLIWCANSKI